MLRQLELNRQGWSDKPSLHSVVDLCKGNKFSGNRFFEVLHPEISVGIFAVHPRLFHHLGVVEEASLAGLVQLQGVPFRRDSGADLVCRFDAKLFHEPFVVVGVLVKTAENSRKVPRGARHS